MPKRLNIIVGDQTGLQRNSQRIKITETKEKLALEQVQRVSFI